MASIIRRLISLLTFWVRKFASTANTPSKKVRKKPLHSWMSTVGWVARISACLMSTMAGRYSLTITVVNRVIVLIIPSTLKNFATAISMPKWATASRVNCPMAPTSLIPNKPMIIFGMHCKDVHSATYSHKKKWISSALAPKVTPMVELSCGTSAWMNASKQSSLISELATLSTTAQKVSGSTTILPKPPKKIPGKNST